MKIIGKILIALIGALILFYFWAGSGQLSKEQLSQVFKYETGKKSKQDSIFSLISYNIGYLSGMTNNSATKPSKELFETNMQKVIKGLAPYEADLIAFQEIDFGSSRSYHIDQFDNLAKKLQFPYGGSTVNWDKHYVPYPYWPISVHFGMILSGQAILSRFPIINQERVVLERVASNPFYYDHVYLDRLVQVNELDWNGQHVTVMNVHLEAFDKPTRQSQTDYILQLYHQYGEKGPVILMGDFNSAPPGGVYYGDKTTLETLLNDEDLQTACPKELYNKQCTYPTEGEGTEHIDFIFTDPDWIEVLEYKRLDEVGAASDHFPIMMKFRFKSEEEVTNNQ